MGKLFTDIETLPARDDETIELIRQTLKPPGNIKKKESIEAWLDDPQNLENAVLKTSFDGMFGDIFCISYAIDDEDPQTLSIVDTDEKEMLIQFARTMRRPNQKTPHEIIGHRIKSFDIPFISKRMMKHGLGPLFPHGTNKYKMLATCTGEMWCGDTRDYIKLDTLCKGLGVETPKNGIDGSQVYEYFKAGRTKEIIEYCERDVEATRQVYKIMRGEI